MTENDMTENPTPAPKQTSSLRIGAWTVVSLLLAFTLYNLFITAQDYLRGAPPRRTITFHIDGEDKFLWAKGSREFGDPDSEWFNLTGSPLPMKDFQYGIGKDRIPSIDDPVFVDPDDDRLAAFWKENGVTDLDKLKIIGYEHNGVARAYPRALLDGHELVNDTIGGKPVTVGW